MRLLSSEDGLSQNLVFCILQDREGFMWFGTKEGLNRYDGYKFKVYRNDPSDTNSLPSNYITVLYEDKSGMLWVGTALNGLCSFDRANGIFHRYKSSDSGDSLSLITNPSVLTSNRITTIFEDSRGNLWVGTDKGLNMLDPARKRIKHFRYSKADPFSIGNNYIFSIAEDKNGTLWIGTGDGADVFNYSSNNFSRFDDGPLSPGSRYRNEISSILPAPDGTVWFTLRTSLEHYIPFHLQTNGFSQREPFGINGRFDHYEMPGTDTTFYDLAQLVEDHDGNFWLTSIGKLIRFNIAAKKFTIVRTDPSTVSIYCDNTGALWFGTGGYGVYRYSLYENRFELYKNELIENVVFGNIISKLNKFARKKFSYQDVHGQSCAEDAKGNVWIATLRDGVFFYDIRKNKFTRYLFHPELKYDDLRRQVYFVYLGKTGKIWIGVQFGIAELDRHTGHFTYHRLYPEQYNFLGFERISNSYDITCLYEDSSGILWAGTPAIGLIRFNPADESKKYYSFNPGNTTGVNSNFILSIEPDPREPSRYLWLGTDGAGLNKLDIQTGHAEHFTVENGLPNNVVYAVLADSTGNLWMSTNKGLCDFNPVDSTFHDYDARDGLQSYEFNRTEFYKARDGKMYFGGIKGVNAFYPERIRTNQHIPPVVLTDFKIFNRTVKPQKGVLNHYITYADSIVLNFSDNIISFEFAALDFSAPWKNNYAYMLEGFNKEWINTGTDRTVTFTNLDPGEYILRVKGSNGDGVWNETGRAITLIITPPFWMTTWFRIAAGLFVFLLVAGTARYIEMRKIKERTRRLEQEAAIERERLRISKDMHDDIGSRLTQIGLLSKIAQRDIYQKSKEHSAAIENQDPLRSEASRSLREKLEDISDASDEIVTALDEIVWAVNPKYDNIEEVMDYLAQFATAYLERANIGCTVDIPSEESKIYVPSEIRHSIFMVMKESLNNIVKYSGTNEVSIKFELSSSQLSMTVRDYGKGFEEEKVKKFSDGLNNMKKRMEDVGGACEIVSGEGKGTKVSVSIPLQRR